MEVHAKYLDKYKGSKALPGVASLIAASLVAAPANEALSIVNELQSVLASGQVATFSDNDEIPKAYLQYLYFDNDYKFKKSGFRQVSKQGVQLPNNNPNIHQILEGCKAGGKTIRRAGAGQVGKPRIGLS